jgi:hypothetical protein
MKILKAQSLNPKKQIFQISDLTYIDRMTPLKELLNGEDMIEPIEVMKHDTYISPVNYKGETLIDYKNQRSGANGATCKEKKYSVWKGSQRIQAALQLGYTHIEGIIIND